MAKSVCFYPYNSDRLHFFYVMEYYVIEAGMITLKLRIVAIFYSSRLGTLQLECLTFLSHRPTELSGGP